MNKPNIIQQLRRTFSALAMIGALLTAGGLLALPKAQADQPTAAQGFWMDCENLISLQSHGPNTIVVLSITETFTGTFTGTWVGTERDTLVDEQGGRGQGSGVFTGSVAGRSGTMIFSYLATFAPNGRVVTHWVVDQGTDELAGIHGQGTTPSGEDFGPTDDCNWDTFTVEYAGQIQFAP
jgi:hypothetical protein